VSKILVVEDDPAVREVLGRALSQEGIETEAVGSGEEALRRLSSDGCFDLVVLDVMLPGGVDGFSACWEIRTGAVGEASKDMPIVMLSARDDETSVVVGLEVSADDYVTKPFSPRELVSRIRAHLRRRRLNNSGGEEQRQRFEFPGLELDLLRREVTSQGEPISLTAKEFNVLALLASSPGRVYCREQIMAHLWGGDFHGELRAADVHVQHIRKKIELDSKKPRYLLTVRGVGYKFADLP
jgi:DNA-binding response OmpR family regulator